MKWKGIYPKKTFHNASVLQFYATSPFLQFFNTDFIQVIAASQEEHGSLDEKYGSFSHRVIDSWNFTIFFFLENWAKKIKCDKDQYIEGHLVGIKTWISNKKYIPIKMGCCSKKMTPFWRTLFYLEKRNYYWSKSFAEICSTGTGP